MGVPASLVVRSSRNALGGSTPPGPAACADGYGTSCRPSCPLPPCKCRSRVSTSGKIAPVNERLWRWFDNGHAVEALLGREGHFIPSVTYRERHDDVLVLNQLASWADDRGRWDELVQAVDDAVRQAVADDDLRTGFGIAWAAIIVGDDTSNAMFDPSAMLQVLDEAMRDYEGSDPEVAAIAERVLPRLGSA